MNEIPIELARATVHRYRVKDNFDRKYEAQGGSEVLLQMALNGSTLRETGDFFKLHPQRISQIYRSITDTPWPHGPGPRKEKPQ